MPLRLDLLRHGDALPAGNGGDGARALSPIGLRDIARIADEFGRRGWHPDRVIASPLRRAQETAARILSRVGPGRTAETLDELDPRCALGDLVAALHGRILEGHVLLVGHQPLLGMLASHLTRDRDIGLPPGGLVGIRFEHRLEAGSGVVEIRLRPEQL